MSKLLKVEDFCDLAPDALRWYVVQSEPNQERLAFGALTFDMGIDTYLPMRAVEKKTALHRAPLFPRYLFVRLDLQDESWWRMFTARGFHRVMGDRSPLPIERGAVRRIRAQEVEGLIKLKGAQAAKAAGKSPYTSGMALRITGGPMVDRDALFMHGDANRITVMLSMLGSQRITHMGAGDVRAAS